jgi:hypothetical protein
MQLKELLRRIDENARNLLHGRLPSIEAKTRPQSGTSMPLGGRPPHPSMRFKPWPRQSAATPPPRPTPGHAMAWPPPASSARVAGTDVFSPGTWVTPVRGHG